MNEYTDTAKWLKYLLYVGIATLVNSVLKLKAIEAMQKVADGKATKIIIPSEMQGLVGLANGIVEGTKE